MRPGLFADLCVLALVSFAGGVVVAAWFGFLVGIGMKVAQWIQ